MDPDFRWNPFADQPHNVAPKKARLRRHLFYLPGYFRILGANLCLAAPGLARYLRYRKRMYARPLLLDRPFGVAVSPAGERTSSILEALKELGVGRTLIRIPSWETAALDTSRSLVRTLHEAGIEVTAALLQSREDVRRPAEWEAFLEEVFAQFSGMCSVFEIGHAWNRTKWGVWDFREYLRLAFPAMDLSRRYGVRLAGPAVIDFEFHLYPPVLKRLPFDVVTSLLYVDRVGAPENRQFGWDTPGKVALLRAVVDSCLPEGRPLWVTEVNWPLEGTGKYSPAAGKANVSESAQADYLVRYYLLCLASGYVDRIYWWQLVAPGYGLIDDRSRGWRKRPSFAAMKTMVRILDGARFLRRIPHPRAYIFLFHRKGEDVAVCWTRGQKEKIVFSGRVERVEDAEGRGVPSPEREVEAGPSPVYAFLGNL